jgi:hypothetical protein
MLKGYQLMPAAPSVQPHLAGALVAGVADLRPAL